MKLSAQTTTEVKDFQTWTDVNLNYFKTPRLTFGGDAGIRGLFTRKNWTQIYARPTVKYVVTPVFSTSGGVAFFNTFNKKVSNIFEVRAFQNALLTWPELGYVNFTHRVRLEERWLIYSKTSNRIKSRVRYALSMRTINFKLIGNRKEYYLSGAWEAFIPIGKSAPELFVNNQRWDFALGYRYSDRTRYELHYLWQRSRQFVDGGFETRENIVRLRMFFTLGELPER